MAFARLRSSADHSTSKRSPHLRLASGRKRVKGPRGSLTRSCVRLQVVTQKLAERAVPYADRMMELFLQVFASKNSTVHEEALMAVGAIANGERVRPSMCPVPYSLSS